MFSTLRNRFGIPGVISVIALVFAMLGGAYAASNSADGKNATASAKKKAAKGPRGPRGATGPAGPAGAQGPAGPAGANGEKGATGPTGPTGEEGPKGSTGEEGQEGIPGTPGEPWTAGGTLPPGATETGTFAIANPEGYSKNTQFVTPISFPIPLIQPLDQEHSLGLTPGFDGSSEENAEQEHCPGKASAPKAAAGYLCVYTQAAENLILQKAFILRSDSTGFEFGAATSGARLLFAQEGPELGSGSPARAHGTFAVTGCDPENGAEFACP